MFRTVFYEMELVQFLISVVSLKDAWSTKEYLAVSGMEIIKNDLLQQMENKDISIGYRCMVIRCLISLCCTWSLAFTCSEIQKVLEYRVNNENLLVYQTAFLILSIRMFKENEKIQEIQNLLTTTLQLPISFSSEKYQFIRQIIQEMFNNELLAKSSLVLLKQGEITEKHDLSIVLACNLLQANIFDQEDADFLAGILFVFEKATYMNQPLRDLLHLSMESASIKIIPEDYIAKAVGKPVDYHVSLLSYYVYLHRKTALSSPGNTKPNTYTDALLDIIPVKKVLGFIQTNLNFIFPEMVALVSLQSPSYYHVTNKLLELTQNKPMLNLEYLVDHLETFEDLKTAIMEELDESRKSQYIKVLQLLPNELLQSNFNSFMDLLVGDYSYEYRQIWVKQYLNAPSITCTATLNYFGITGNYISNPLLIFEAFQTKDKLLQIFLQILNHSGSEFRHKIRTGRTIFSSEKDSAMLAYDSLVIQRLFSMISVSPELICKYVHQVFVDRPACIRLVNIQGYDFDIIPIVVDLIPSMHVCTDYCAEITNVNPRFGITLATFLCKKYPLDKT
ncbi:Integrator complex subunit 2 [Terramyces sp. JEL0728]|nr:Integrator complex subunit 2 [Terramyces sp. JEL0728]